MVRTAWVLLLAAALVPAAHAARRGGRELSPGTVKYLEKADVELENRLGEEIGRDPIGRSDRCHADRPYFWYRPDQRRDSTRDEPEHHPRKPHARAIGAGQAKSASPFSGSVRPQVRSARGFSEVDVDRLMKDHPHFHDEYDRRRALAQELSPADDPIGYRGLCVFHHEGPLCQGKEEPLPSWVSEPDDRPAPPHRGSWRGTGAYRHSDLE